MATRTISDNKFYVYFHINPLTNKIFYIGKGHENRAYCIKGRNPYWNNTFKKYGLIVDIIENNLTEEKALEREMFYIDKIKISNLTNLTIGGDGIKKGQRFSPNTEFKKGVNPFNKGKGLKFGIEIICKNCKHKYIRTARKGTIYCSKKCQGLDPEFRIKSSNAISKEERYKRSIRQKNKILLEETKEKIRNSNTGKIPWNKGLSKETDIRVKKYGENKSKNTKVKKQ
ncbi:MAG: hypothetical protein IT212_07555 [Bacteroidia bacterium]|nr:hypothetical protein [Bacteroidia bacterium]